MNDQLEHDTIMAVYKCHTSTEDPVMKEACRLFLHYILENEEKENVEQEQNREKI